MVPKISQFDTDQIAKGLRLVDNDAPAPKTEPSQRTFEPSRSAIVKFRGWKKSGGLSLLEAVHEDGARDHLFDHARSIQRPPLP